MKPFRLWVYCLLVRFLPETRCFWLKALALRWCGARVGSGVRINSSAVFLGCGNLSIGDCVWVGPQCFVSSVGGAAVKIGACCDLAPRVTILTGTHAIDFHGAHAAGQGRVADVSIEDGCWIGAGATILPGVTLLGKTVVAAGSLVRDSTAHEFSLVAGVPACEKKVYTDNSSNGNS